jgi:hypothetical protein
MEKCSDKLHLNIKSSCNSNKGVIQVNARTEKRTNTETFTPIPGFKMSSKKIDIVEISLSDDVNVCQLPRSTKNVHRREAKFGDFSEFSSDSTLSSHMPNFVQNYNDLINLIQSKEPIKTEDEFEQELKQRNNKSTFYKKNSTKSHDKLIKSKLKYCLTIVDKLITKVERRQTIASDNLSKEDQDKVKNLTNIQEIKDFYEYTEECMKRIVKLNVPSLDEIEHLRFNLPNHIEEQLKTKKLAIFDLDETLIHCEIKDPAQGQVKIKVKLPSGQRAKVKS